MLAFEIEIDDKRWLVAGANEWKLLNFQLNASRYVEPLEISAGVGGSEADGDDGCSYSFRWASVNLALGSKVTVTIVETDEVDPPPRRYRYDAVAQENPFTAEEEAEMERAEWLRLKAKFEPENSK